MNTDAKTSPILSPVTENVFVDLLAGVTGLFIVYAVAADVLNLERSGSARLFMFSFGILVITLFLRFGRLRRLGGRLLLASIPDPHNGTKYLAWLLVGAVLGAYSSRELYLGSFGVGAIGCLTSIAAMWAIAIGLARKSHKHAA
jgi:hypothetical protein